MSDAKWRISLGRFLIATSLALHVSPALAQDCTATLTTIAGFGSGSSAEIDRNFACLVSELAALKSSLGTAQTNVSSLTTQVAGLSGALPSGMVVAFDRDQKQETLCPDGWEYFEPAGGRTIIGAGDHDNQWFPEGSDTPIAISSYSNYAQDSYRGTQETSKASSTGGEERHLLGEPEMPQHEHSLTFVPEASSLSGNDYPVMSDYPRNRSSTTTVTTGGKGGNQPHNNMPPYIALYYCKKT